MQRTAPAPTVSVLMPARHAERWVADAVASLIAQSTPGWELELVADDSVDYAAVLAAAGIDDRRIRHHRTDRPASGPAAARNVGLAAARGRFVAPLDADDVFAPTRLERLLPLAARHGVAADRVLVRDRATDRVLGVAPGAERPPSWLSPEAYVGVLTPLTLVLDRALAGEGWDEAVRFGEDTLFNLRVLCASGGAPLDPRPLHEYRVTAGSACHAADATERAEAAYRTCLARLDDDGLGLRGAAARVLARRALEHRRAANRAFARHAAANPGASFQGWALAAPAATAAA
ncbi:MAG: glycosyltransferase family 2 protein [Ectothiorhodospiraceae bacterium]|nr:glycosyltransferase family 2 protein [Ectothiorhodospiraceae bacterium]